MRLSVTRTANRSISPQTGFVTSTVAEASNKSPGLCGLLKWSRMISLNIASQYIPNEGAVENDRNSGLYCFAFLSMLLT